MASALQRPPPNFLTDDAGPAPSPAGRAASWRRVRRHRDDRHRLVTHGRLAGIPRGPRARRRRANPDRRGLHRPRRRHGAAPAGHPRSIAEVNTGDGTVLLTDMFGGTPSNLAISVMDRGKVEVIAGVNLPMLIKLASLRQSEKPRATPCSAPRKPGANTSTSRRNCWRTPANEPTTIPRPAALGHRPADDLQPEGAARPRRGAVRQDRLLNSMPRSGCARTAPRCRAGRSWG